MKTEITEIYEGTSIAFSSDLWINATHMASLFKMRPYEFLRLPATKRFIEALEKQIEAGPTGKSRMSMKTENFPTTYKTVKSVKDGQTPGTWMHPDLALEFARWLAPEFALWCNRTIRKILSGEGQTTPVQFASVGTPGAVLVRVEILHRYDLPPPPTDDEEQVAELLKHCLPYYSSTTEITAEDIAYICFKHGLFRERLTSPTKQTHRSDLFSFLRSFMCYPSKPARWIRHADGRQFCLLALGLPGHRRYRIQVREQPKPVEHLTQVFYQNEAEAVIKKALEAGAKAIGVKVMSLPDRAPLTIAAA